MKYILAMALLLNITAAAADTYVRGYNKENGTYVEPHRRSSPDSNPYNNYSTQGNTNPYNGKQGNVEPSYNPRPNSRSYEINPTKTDMYGNAYGN